MNNCAVVIPVYKKTFDEDEIFSISHSLINLKGHDIYWVAPQSLDINYYIEKFNAVNFVKFEDEFFKNIEGYNRLLVSLEFYQRFINYEFMLICQPDAIVLKPELHLWIEKPYDYIGAPWPQGFSLKVKTKKIPLEEGINCTAFVGNGGLSLRRNSACISLLQEFEDLQKEWLHMGHAEDLYFSLIGSISENFRIPNIINAALFSHDIGIEQINKLINNKIPFGIHAWEKYDRGYALSMINSQSA